MPNTSKVCCLLHLTPGWLFYSVKLITLITCIGAFGPLTPSTWQIRAGQGEDVVPMLVKETFYYSYGPIIRSCSPLIAQMHFQIQIKNQNVVILDNVQMCVVTPLSIVVNEQDLEIESGWLIFYFVLTYRKNTAGFYHVNSFKSNIRWFLFLHRFLKLLGSELDKRFCLFVCFFLSQTKLLQRKLSKKLLILQR